MAKKAVREKLEDETEIIHDKLDKILKLDEEKESK